MADKSLSDFVDATLREAPDRKERFRRRVETEVKRQLGTWQDRLDGFRLRLKILKEDIESVNPRFAPIQLHTKTKWQNELVDLIAEFETFLVAIREPTFTWEE